MSTKLIRSIHQLKSPIKGGVLTIGNFDGVHLGHQQLISKVVNKAKELQCHSTVITFEPHPFEYFDKENLKVARLTRLREKFLFLSQLGVDNVVIIQFNQTVANLSASDFISLIYQKLRPQHIMIGDDFHFGYKRQGNYNLLEKRGHELGFTVSALETIIVEGERVSSTRIRQLLEKGELNLVNKLLNRPFTLQGKIRGGDQRGRLLGFPTANIFLHRKVTPLKGVYTVYVHGIAKNPLPGVANIGTRPTINGSKSLLEVHLLDFDQDIYGYCVEVEFCKKLRDEVRFNSLDLLKEQIAKDVKAARNYFK